MLVEQHIAALRPYAKGTHLFHLNVSAFGQVAQCGLYPTPTASFVSPLNAQEYTSPLGVTILHSLPGQYVTGSGSHGIDLFLAVLIQMISRPHPLHFAIAAFLLFSVSVLMEQDIVALRPRVFRQPIHSLFIAQMVPGGSAPE